MLKPNLHVVYKLLNNHYVICLCIVTFSHLKGWVYNNHYKSLLCIVIRVMQLENIRFYIKSCKCAASICSIAQLMSSSLWPKCLSKHGREITSVGKITIIKLM